MTVESLEKTYIDDINTLGDWFLQYEYLIRLAKDLKPLDAEQKTDENKVPGCQSGVWLSLREKDGSTFIEADSDALIIKGILAIIIGLLNGRQNMEIVSYKPRFIEETNIKRQISADRFNGINAVINKIKEFAGANSKQTY